MPTNSFFLSRLSNFPVLKLKTFLHFMAKNLPKRSDKSMNAKYERLTTRECLQAKSLLSCLARNELQNLNLMLPNCILFQTTDQVIGFQTKRLLKNKMVCTASCISVSTGKKKLFKFNNNFI